MPVPPSAEFLQLQPLIAGRYSIERELGRGGMGIVFLARDVALDRPVAIKLLPPSVAMEADLRERFLREARTVAKLSHPNIVPIHVVEEHGDVVYFVMTYVDGETLGQRVRRAGPLPAPHVTRIVQEVAWALAYAHGRGIVHRDVKPDNILLDKDSGRAMVTDFGIARMVGAGTMSRSGEIVGTASYMSPEQASGEGVDGRSDLFSLGVTAFYALTGKLPFEGPTLHAVVARIVAADAPRLSAVRADIPVALAQSVDRCLAKEPAARFASGEELADAVGVAVVSREAAPQLRHLLKAARDLDIPFGLLGTAVLVIPQLLPTLWASHADRFDVVWLLVMLAVPAASASVVLIHAARQVLKAGFGAADVKRALERAARAAHEEAEAVGLSRTDPAERLSKRRRLWRRLGHIGMGGALAGAAIAVVIAALSDVTTLPRNVAALTALPAILGILGYSAAFALGLRLKAGETSTVMQSLALGERLLGTRFVNWLFRVAGLGLNVRTQNEPPARERTEVLIASAAGDLFARLPADLKQQFAMVPAVVHRLEIDADVLRKRESELSRAALEVGPMHERPESRPKVLAEIEAARMKVRERLASAVAALESIRLNLLRLEVGVGTADELTADIERAQTVGTSVSAELYGRREITRLLTSPSQRGLPNT